MPYPIGLTCQQLVELVTDYLEDTLPAEARACFELHLCACPGCQDYLDQIRRAIAASGHLAEDALAPHVREALLRVFRTWHRSGEGRTSG
jgi:anti-sigma factor RsiW